MNTSGKRRSTVRNNGVAAGSVWDTRIKMDEFEGGVKVFNSRTDPTKDEEESPRVHRSRTVNRIQSPVATAERRKRRTWNPQEPSAVATSIRTHNSRRSCSSDQEEEDLELEDKEIDVPVEKEMNVQDITPILPNILKNQICTTDISIGKEPEIAKPDLGKLFSEENYVPDISKELEIAKSDSIKSSISSDILKNKNYVTDTSKEPEIAKSNSNINKEPKIARSDSTETKMFESTSGTSDMQTRMHNIVDLIMWRDISRSVFVFGFGNFILLASSYAKDLNFSLIQIISYLCFAYLAVIFLYKSILGRGSLEFDERDKKFMIGEEEAIWVLRFLLPRINEVLLKIRVLFSGHPATTMKLALVLFVLGRCGGSISICTLSRLAFFGIFTIPKLHSCYHVQLYKYGGFWSEKFQDEWELCAHKKVIAAAVFIVVWIVSSPVSRICAVFMLVVAMKQYQQCAVEKRRSSHEDDYKTSNISSSSPLQQHRQKINGAHISSSSRRGLC